MSHLNVTIKSFDGATLGGYFAPPGNPGPAPGIVLIQEIFGVNAVMRDMADSLAGQGFAVVCPDLFWRQQPGVDIGDKSQAEWDQAFALFGGFDVDLGIADLIATLDWLRAHRATTGRIGTVGYCLGGQLAYLMACRSEVDAAVGYYAVRLTEFMDEAARITNPLLLHVAREDEFVPGADQDKVAAAFADNPHIALHRYDGLGHAFARPGGAHYDEAAAGLANRRTLDFFRRHLGTKP